MKLRTTVSAIALALLSAVAQPIGADTLVTPVGEVAESAEVAARKPITELGRQRSYYLAGSEPLAEDEMRVFALGTGMPQIQRAQASACYYVELGNGDSFVFDLGMGCTVNMSLLEQPWDKFTKVFLTHLHYDHFGDMGALVAGGWQMGRSIPIEVWGPSGDDPSLGTKAAMDGMMAMLRWEYVSKRGRAPMSSYALKVHEFDFAKEQVVYDRNGVVIRAFPAVHTMDGGVSYSLEWKGMKITYSGDTTPNKWFVEHSKGADMVIHDCSDPVSVLIHSRKHPPESAWLISTTSHTQPEIAGTIFSTINPRMAVCTHYVNNGLDAPEKLYAAVRQNYQGPLAVAEDLDMWNVSPRGIRQRKLIGGEYSFSLPRGREAPDVSKLVEPAPWLRAGRLDTNDAYKRVLDGLDPESRQRIIERVPADLRPH